MQRRDDRVITKGLQVVQNQAQAAPQKCPRCDSLNTKFCYYNNYSLSQPRYLCKNCRRYWTQGGTLRNVPVGGGSRKAKRPKLSSSDNSRAQQPPPPSLPLPLPSSLTSPQHVVFSGTPVMITTSSFFNPSGEQLESSNSSCWINSFGSSSLQGQCQIQAPETLFEMTDQPSRKAAVTSTSPAGWPESYINNPIVPNPMTAAGNPTNNSGSINQYWPDHYI